MVAHLLHHADSAGGRQLFNLALGPLHEVLKMNHRPLGHDLGERRLPRIWVV